MVPVFQWATRSLAICATVAMLLEGLAVELLWVPMLMLLYLVCVAMATWSPSHLSRKLPQTRLQIKTEVRNLFG